MIIRKDRRIAYLLTIAVQIFMGAYSGAVNTEYVETNVFEEIFIKVKSPIEFDYFEDGFSIGVILNLLYIIITVIFVSLFVSRDYKARCYYFATRYGSFGKFYISILTYCISLCVISELSYDLGAAFSVLIKFENLDFSISELFLCLLVNSLTIIIIFSYFGVIISLLMSEKTGILISVTLFLMFAVVMFYLPSDLIQYDIVSWYFVKEFIYNRDIFKNSKFIYYLIALLIFLGEYFVSNKLLKKDTL